MCRFVVIHQTTAVGFLSELSWTLLYFSFSSSWNCSSSSFSSFSSFSASSCFQFITPSMIIRSRNEARILRGRIFPGIFSLVRWFHLLFAPCFHHLLFLFDLHFDRSIWLVQLKSGGCLASAAGRSPDARRTLRGGRDGSVISAIYPPHHRGQRWFNDLELIQRDFPIF